MTTSKLIVDATWRGILAGFISGGILGVLYGMLAGIAFMRPERFLNVRIVGMSDVGALLFGLTFFALLGIFFGAGTGALLGLCFGAMGGFLFGLVARVFFFADVKMRRFNRTVRMLSGLYGLIAGFLAFEIYLSARESFIYREELARIEFAIIAGVFGVIAAVFFGHRMADWYASEIEWYENKAGGIKQDARL